MGPERRQKVSKDLISYCGRYCGDCFLYKGEIADLARDLRQKLSETKVDSQKFSKYIKAFQDYEKCYEVLGAMAGLRCERACQNGGGTPSCKIRACCQRKDIPGCWDCQEFNTCDKLDVFKPIHGDANIKNLRKLKKEGVEAFLSGNRYY